MLTILIISAIFLIWWIISIFFLRNFFKKHTGWRIKASRKFSKIIIVIGFIIYALGGAANVAVSAANGWKMPVTEYGQHGEECKEEHDFLHTCINQNTRLAFLGDIFHLRPIGYMLSIGDIFLVLGTTLMTLQRIWIFLPTKKPH